MEYRIPDDIIKIDKEWINEHIPKDVTKVICSNSLKRIVKSAFENHKKLEEIKLNEGLEIIDKFAFYKSNLKTVIMPSTLKTIGEYAFEQCNKLEEVKLNEGLNYIGKHAFAETMLKKIIIPGTVETIYPYTFNNDCSSLEEIRINNGVKNIYDFAFGGLHSFLKRIIIPDSVEFISCDAFALKLNQELEKTSVLPLSIRLINCKVIIGSKSPIAQLCYKSYHVDIFGYNVKIFIEDLEEDIDYNLFNNIKKVSDGERNKLGLMLFDEINKDDIDLKKVQELLINGADTEIRDSNGNTGLMLMIKKGNNEISMMYLLSGSDVNARNKLKETPLILASRNNNNDIAFELIDRNCIVNAMSVFDESALSIAYDNGNIELVSRLENILNISSKEKELEEVQKVRKKVFGK